MTLSQKNTIKFIALGAFFLATIVEAYFLLKF